MSPAEIGEASHPQALRDALAESYGDVGSRCCCRTLDGADEDEARAMWDGLWPAARWHAARRLAEQGLR